MIATHARKNNIPESDIYSIDAYDYHLPPELIAQTPCGKRDSSRLMIIDKNKGEISHGRFSDIENILRPGDCLVINDTRVVPARLFGKKETGGRVEVLILNYHEGVESNKKGNGFICECLVKASKAPLPQARILFEMDLWAEVIKRGERTFFLRFHAPCNPAEIIEKIGCIPLPPYIQRNRHPDTADRESYQTVYARKDGSVAAPTAGLHFTPDLLSRLEKKGIKIAPITLHVGYGTFAPVKEQDVRRHRMHRERYMIPEQSAKKINTAKNQGKRVVAVGTTSVRTIEYCSDHSGRVKPGAGWCDLFIYPGYRFKSIDAMITNFHLPRSTLIMLVSAFAGRELILSAYQTAAAMGYRFYSYGDAMFIG